MVEARTASRDANQPIIGHFSRPLDWLYRIRYISSVKPVSFLSRSLAAIRAFPDGARRAAGYQIERLQRGLDPDDWKPMKTVGPGVREIRLRDSTGVFRVIYLASLADAVYVLHAFQKKSQATSKADREIARRQFRQLMETIRR